MRKSMDKILVTGGAGFIGSEFVRQGVKAGKKVIVVDSITYAGDLERLKEVKGKIDFHQVDIANFKKLNAVVQQVRPSIIVNFAAETHVDRSILYAETAVRTNVMGTQAMVEAAKNADIKRFIHISTDEVYGDIEKGQFHETTPLNPSSPYSAGKAAGDMLIRAYARTYQFPAIIIRPSNNYGPWQYPEKFMPVMIYKIMKNEKIPVYGKGHNVREWLYVSDCAAGVWKVLEKGKVGEAYNIGSGNEQRNIDVVKKVLAVMNKSEDLIEYVQDRPGHDIRYALNFSKIRKDIGWEPRISFDEGVEKTIAFYTRRLDWLEKKVKYLKSFWKKVYIK
jgi:dTDP-glucose 4,6-dehydratase